jgi:predicted rRNA methylase YqxC with S4 and FtsJ domains
VRQTSPCSRSSSRLVDGITESPITGPEGNREFLIAAERA